MVPACNQKIDCMPGTVTIVCYSNKTIIITVVMVSRGVPGKMAIISFVR